MNNLDELKNISDKALQISIIKILVLQDLNEKIKNKIDSNQNDFYQPSEQNIQTQDNFKSFINNLSDKILKELYSF